MSGQRPSTSRRSSSWSAIERRVLVFQNPCGLYITLERIHHWHCIVGRRPWGMYIYCLPHKQLFFGSLSSSGIIRPARAYLGWLFGWPPWTAHRTPLSMLAGVYMNAPTLRDLRHWIRPFLQRQRPSSGQKWRMYEIQSVDFYFIFSSSSLGFNFRLHPFGYPLGLHRGTVLGLGWWSWIEAKT